MQADSAHEPSLPHPREQATAARGKAAVLLAEALEKRALLEPDTDEEADGGHNGQDRQRRPVVQR
jgi:hypothetical protein